jgi:hypothetical protein
VTRRVAAVGLLAVGLASILVAGGALLSAWRAEQAWNVSSDRERAERLAQAEPPLWIESEPAPAVPGGQAAASPPPTSLAARPALPTLTPRPREAPVLEDSLMPRLTTGPAPAARRARADDIRLGTVDFRFLEPPEPGAHARLTVELASGSDLASAPVLVRIPNRWFATFAPIAAEPEVTDDRIDGDGYRSFVFPGLQASASQTLQLEVRATDEGVDAPEVVVQLDAGEVIGKGQPRTVAPKPRPGPAYSLAIPRVGIKSAVKPTPWDPPDFVVGQLRGSANVTEGNTLLIGHLRGPGGDVFGHLDRVKLGDEVVAVSRGLEYRFVASSIAVLPNTDQTPLQATDTPRLTLMTCTGTWNPITDEYSHRLWVIAEPPDLAKATIAANEERRAAEALAKAAEQAAAEAVAIQAARVAFKGEVSPMGGLGNSRVDVERAYGVVTGETRTLLEARRRADGSTFNVGFSTEPERARVVVQVLPPERRLPFEAAVLEARKLMPTDSEPRAAYPEGNPQYVVERFSSPALGRAMGPIEGAPNGEYDVVYEKDAQGRVARIVLGQGTDVDALRARGAP